MFYIYEKNLSNQNSNQKIYRKHWNKVKQKNYMKIKRKSARVILKKYKRMRMREQMMKLREILPERDKAEESAILEETVSYIKTLEKQLQGKIQSMGNIPEALKNHLNTSIAELNINMLREGVGRHIHMKCFKGNNNR